MDRDSDEAKTRNIEEELAEIEYSDSEETSIDALKRIRFDKWASDMRKRQDELYEHMKYQCGVKDLGPPSQDHPMVSRISFFQGSSDIISIPWPNYTCFSAAKNFLTAFTSRFAWPHSLMGGTE